MISEFFIDIAFGLGDFVFGLLPEMDWTVDTGAFEFLSDALAMVAYLLPMDTITAIFVLIFNIAIVRIVISFIRTAIGLIPFI